MNYCEDCGVEIPDNTQLCDKCFVYDDEEDWPDGESEED